MLRITDREGGLTATCGRAVCELPIIRRTDPLTGDELVEAISSTGIKSLFRKGVDVTYTPTRTVSEDGEVRTSYVPKCRLYSTVEELLTKVVMDRFGGALIPVYRSEDRESATRELSKIVSKAMNMLCNEEWSSECEASYEVWANSHTITLLDSPLPSVPGRFTAELEADRRMTAARYLVEIGAISSPCCTGTGDPGRLFYSCNQSGYTYIEHSNPLIREVPEKRRGVVNAVKNAVEIVGEEPSPVEIIGVTKSPHMTNAVVACLPIAGDDSVIISETLAKKLTARYERSRYSGIDMLINHHGGLRYRGRKGALVKTESECPQNMEIVRLADGSIELRRRSTGMSAAAGYKPSRDAELLRAFRAEYLAKWSGMVMKLGQCSAEEMLRWREWLMHQRAWVERNRQRRSFRRFGTLGVEVVDLDGALMFREREGLEYRAAEVGMKVQSDGDLFKGVVSKILPDDKMPLVKLGGKLVRAQAVAESGASLAKHGSLRFALGQIALYAVASLRGTIEVEIGALTLDDVVDMATTSGLYEDESLTCEVYSSDGKTSFGRFPAGVTRICRHRQDPSVCGRTKGIVADDVPNAQSSMKAGGLVNGLPDTYCMLAAGLPECAKELRANIPAGPAMKLELLRECID